MPFWKQSEDPWDQTPRKRRPAPKEPMESPIDTLKQWNDNRKAAAKEREEAKRLPPETCPWCGKDMEQGFLLAGRGPILWYPGVYKTVWFYRDSTDSFHIDTKGDFIPYQVAWLCRECGKMVLNLPESERIDDFPTSQDDETFEIHQEEETSEE